jgi:hypothetical protein
VFRYLTSFSTLPGYQLSPNPAKFFHSGHDGIPSRRANISSRAFSASSRIFSRSTVVLNTYL